MGFAASNTEDVTLIPHPTSNKFVWTFQSTLFNEREYETILQLEILDVWLNSSYMFDHAEKGYTSSIDPVDWSVPNICSLQNMKTFFHAFVEKYKNDVFHGDLRTHKGFQEAMTVHDAKQPLTMWNLHLHHILHQMEQLLSVRTINTSKGRYT